MSIYKNYLKISLRNIFRQKLYSFINIGGLTAGLAVFILIMLYVDHEYSYDRFYENGDRIYRVYQRQVGNNASGVSNGDTFVWTPGQLAGVMRDEFSDITTATSINSYQALLTVGTESFLEQALLGDEHFFEVFRIPFIKGNRDKALADPKSLVLTESLAAKLFPGKDALGEQVKYGDDELYTVTGIIADRPANTSFDYTFIVSIHADGWFNIQSVRPKWNGSSFMTYLLLNEGTDPSDVEKKFSSLQEKYYDPVDYKNYPFKDYYYLQPLSDIHLSLLSASDILLRGSKRTVNLLAVVAAIILGLACVNYMNLAIARSIKRAKEVGLRKAVGAVKKQIVVQFLSESLLFASLSLVLAIGLVFLLLPVFGELMDRQVSFNFSEFVILIPVVVVIGIISGSYPAFVMSALKPVQVLKGKIEGTLSGGKLQRGLLVLQYSISIVLIVCSLGIYLQNEFMQTTEPGFDRDHILTFRIRDQKLRENTQSIKNEWLSNPRIINATVSSFLPSNVRSSHLVNDEPGSPTDDDLHIYELRADADYVDVFNIKVVAGKYYSKDTEETDVYVINETAAKAFGWTPGEAIGKQFWDERMFTVIGVVKDFHMQSMHVVIPPLVIKKSTDWVNYFSIKISPENMQETIAFIEQTIKKRTSYPFNYAFLDDEYYQLYKNESKLGMIFGAFTVLSILIASLGLFGLAAFMSAQRTKEIGVRKVLGASVQNIVVLLTKDFLFMVLVAFVLSVPVAWYGMSRWLEGFAYRIDISWWMFGGAGVLAVLIALFSVGYLSVKASMANPVDSLKSE
ncbi:MAG TPA: ABC transporter permease [Cyclobacteriaceae bacterium]|nr:ABC transporter permease [Cyclobacteriaceae bacterium]